MGYQQKSYKKFVATAATATLVASAIVPVASAADFSDVAENSEYKTYIDSLTEQGIIKGYTDDNTFRPNNKLTRGQVAIMLGRWLEKNGETVPADWATDSRFSDISSSNEELAQYAALVKDAGVFTGVGGKLNPNQNITRENMAVVLDRVAEQVAGVSLVELAEEAEEKEVTDLNKANADYHDEIQALVNLEISTVSNFRPKEEVSRAHFAKFLYSTIEIIEEVTAAPTAEELQAEVAAIVGKLPVVTTITAENAEAAKTTATEATTALTAIETAITEGEYTEEEVAELKKAVADAKTATEAVTKKADEVIEAGKALVVESVSATNLKSVAVNFNKEVDEETVSGSTVVIKDGTNTISSAVLSLSDDKKTIYITHPSNFTQGKEYTVVVSGVKSVDGKAVNEFNGTATALDTVVPVAESAVLTSPKTLELQFSEPVNFPTAAGVLTDKVQINGINVYASEIDVDNTTGKVTLTLGTALTAGNYTVKVANLNDYAGFPIVAKEFSVSLPEDTLAPSVESVTPTTASKLRVKFSEPVDQTTVVTGNFAVTSGSNNYGISQITRVDATTYDFSLASPLGLGSVVEAQFKYNNIKDYYGNQVKSQQVKTFTVGDDTTLPTITGASVNSSNDIEVTFSEPVQNVNAADFQLLDKDGKVVVGGITNATGKVTSAGTSDTTYVLTVDNALNRFGAYSVKLIDTNDVKDKSVRANGALAQTLAVTLADKVAPQIVSARFTTEDVNGAFNTDADTKDARITLNFSEAMDAATVTNKANYVLGSTSLSDIPGSSITVSADGKAVTITVDQASTAANPTGSFFNNLKVLAVKDTAGNTINAYHFNVGLAAINAAAPAAQDINYSVLSSAPVAVANILDTSRVELVAKNQVKLYAVSGTTFSAIDPNKVSVIAADDTLTSDSNTDPDLAAQVQNVTIAADGKSAVLTLSNNLTADAKFVNSVATTGTTVKLALAQGALTNQDGEKTVATGNDFTNDLALVDEVAPTVKPNTDSKLDVSGNAVTVDFDEAVAAPAGAPALAQALVVRDGEGNLLVPGTDYTAAISSGDVVITLTKANFNSKVTVALANNRTIVDGNSNFANDFGAVESADAVVVTAPADVTPPTLEGVAVGGTADDGVTAGDTLTFTFSEATDKPELTDASFTITGGRTLDLANGGSADWNAAGDELVVTLGAAPTITAADTIAFAAADTVEDVAGNDFGTGIFYTVPTLAGSDW